MNIFEFIIHITVFIDRFLIPLLFAIAFLVFIFGVYNYFIVGGGDKEKRQEGRNYILWGVIGFVVMIAVWGIVNLLINSLGFDVRNRPPLPSFGSPAGYGQQQPIQRGGRFQTGDNRGGGTCSPECGAGQECIQLQRGASVQWTCFTPSEIQYGEGGPCSTDRGCDPGLSCQSGVCTR